MDIRLVVPGVSRAYHLDHIVPISTCWEYQVPEVSASDVRNLQVIPWFVNLSRGAGIRLGRETTVPSRKLLAEPLEGLRYEGDGSCRQVEVARVRRRR